MYHQLVKTHVHLNYMLIVLDEKMVPLFVILIQFAQLFANKLFKEVVDIMICFFFLSGDCC